MYKKEIAEYNHHRINGENIIYFAHVCEKRNNKTLARDQYYAALNEFEIAFSIIKTIDYEKALMMNEKMEQALDKIKELEFIAEKESGAER